MQENFESFLKEKISEADAEKYGVKNLSEEDKEKIRSVLSDKDKLKEILSSPFARELMKKLGK